MSVWEQRQYADLLVGQPGSQGHEREPSVAARSTWEAMSIREDLSATYEAVSLYIQARNTLSNKERFMVEAKKRNTQICIAKCIIYVIICS